MWLCVNLTLTLSSASNTLLPQSIAEPTMHGCWSFDIEYSSFYKDGIKYNPIRNKKASVLNTSHTQKKYLSTSTHRLFLYAKKHKKRHIYIQGLFHSTPNDGLSQIGRLSSPGMMAWWLAALCVSCRLDVRSWAILMSCLDCGCLHSASNNLLNAESLLI